MIFKSRFGFVIRVLNKKRCIILIFFFLVTSCLINIETGDSEVFIHQYHRNQIPILNVNSLFLRSGFVYTHQKWNLPRAFDTKAILKQCKRYSLTIIPRGLKRENPIIIFPLTLDRYFCRIIVQHGYHNMDGRRIGIL